MTRPIIIGSGAAGLTAALELAPMRPILVTAGTLAGNAASAWAQGGIAAAIGADDSPASHAADTMAAGAGLCDAAIVKQVTEAGAATIAFLQNLGARLETRNLGLEAAHSHRRIVHAHDATGAEIIRVLVNAVRADRRIEILENAVVTRLVVQDGAVQGVKALTKSGPMDLPGCFVMLATGGLGGLFSHTTNPAGANGTGIALAARAGADLRDMEFVQFHPTAFDCGLDPMPLISEALRGEGAKLIDDAGVAFMDGQDLAARDIVARAVSAKYAAGGTVFLDARHLNGAHFPKIFGLCRARNIDPETQLIPVRAAAHYHMGGVAVNAQGESGIAGLFAAGEVAATGLHGANRLASNSLLEAVVFARIAAAAILARPARTVCAAGTAEPGYTDAELPRIRKICDENLGILRDDKSLARAIAMLEPLREKSNAGLVAWLVASAALAREESRGGHYRTDFPATDLAQDRSTTINLNPRQFKRAA